MGHLLLVDWFRIKKQTGYTGSYLPFTIIEILVKWDLRSGEKIASSDLKNTTACCNDLFTLPLSSHIASNFYSAVFSWRLQINFSTFLMKFLEVYSPVYPVSCANRTANNTLACGDPFPIFVFSLSLCYDMWMFLLFSIFTIHLVIMCLFRASFLIAVNIVVKNAP